jgi:hypothetical protein
MPSPAPVLDHVVIDVRDRIDEAMRCFSALGFQLTPRGRHTSGSVNHIAMSATVTARCSRPPPPPSSNSPAIAGLWRRAGCGNQSDTSLDDARYVIHRAAADPILGARTSQA